MNPRQRTSTNYLCPEEGERGVGEGEVWERNGEGRERGECVVWWGRWELGEGKGGVFGVVGEMSVCGVDGGWVGGEGGGGGKWRVPSLSGRVVPVCVGGDGGEDGGEVV